MAITYPLSLAELFDRMAFEQQPWVLRKFEEMSGSGGGEWLTVKLSPDLWEVECRSTEMEFRDALALRSRLHLIGHSQAFYMCDVFRQYPQSDPTGSIHGSSTPQVKAVDSGREAMSIKGLPIGYVVSIGDLFSITAGSPSRTVLIEAAETVTADGSGDTAVFAVAPALRPWVAADDAVDLMRPAAKMKIVPGTLRIEDVGAALTRVAFTARQALQAG